MIKAKIKELPADLTDEERKKAENRTVDECRGEMNRRHGKGWRDRDIGKPRHIHGGSKISDHYPSHEDPTSPYYGHVNGEYWMD